MLYEDFNYEIKDECKLAQKLCDRHFGIGADGLVIVRKSDIANAIAFQEYNNDNDD